MKKKSKCTNPSFGIQSNSVDKDQTAKQSDLGLTKMQW